ncbi:MAG: efflux RND transporter periplasmic adaptor subunit [Candidatus Schekmanbacteria bacterium]|nr:MAG: efflux RND transporter periplasmic adaptor subunit [Candidatus Schekmanbacteria bacterium]
MDVDKLKIDRSSEETYYKKKKKRRILSRTITVIIIISLLILLYSLGFFTPSVEVETTVVTSIFPYQAKILLNATGYVVAERKAAVASKGTGRLEYLAVEEGDRVKKGDIIARLENRDALATLNRAKANLVTARFRYKQAKAEYDDAKLDYERKKKLYESGTISKSLYDAAFARFDKAKASLNSAESDIAASEAAVSEAKVQYENTFIHAPFDGTILTKNADVGEIVAPFASSVNSKAAVVTMADMDSLIVEADVSENNINLVKVGQPCIITLDAYPDIKYRGKVHKIVPTAERAKATILTKVAFIDKDERVLPEMSTRVSFLKEEVSKEMIEKTLKVVPVGAVIERGGKKVVFSINDGRAKEIVVKVGKKLGDFLELLEGPEIGTKIILNPSERVKDNVKVEIRE